MAIVVRARATGLNGLLMRSTHIESPAIDHSRAKRNNDWALRSLHHNG